MVKILMFSARDDEHETVERWSREHDVHVDMTPDELGATTVDRLRDYDGLLVQQHAAVADPGIYAKLREYGIRQISLRIAGYDIIDLQAASANGLVVTNVPAYSPRSVSELVLAHTMRLIRHLGISTAREARGDFTWDGLEAPEIHNLTVGIIGAGNIGSAVARIFKALGATVIANDLVQRQELSDTVRYVELHELLHCADIVTIHTPLDGTTRHLLNAQTIGEMKPTAFLINAARGPIVDTPALIEALESQSIAGAGLDVVEGESGIFSCDLGSAMAVDEVNPMMSKLMNMPNVELSPHIGFYTDAAVSHMATTALDDAMDVLCGRPCAHRVN